MKKEILGELTNISAVPEYSAKAFHEHLTLLVDSVNKKMVSRPDLESLIGQNPVNVMFDNHRNHAVFMDNVFQLNLFSLLPDIVPWVYRAYRNHGFSFDYFPVHLAAWEETLREFFDQKIRDPLLQIYEWMLSRHSDFIAMAEEVPYLTDASNLSENQDRDKFLQALIQGDRKTALQMSQERTKAPQDLKIFYQQILQPVMYRIGDMWEQGNLSVSREHLASALANMAVSNQYIQLLSDSEFRKGKVLVTAAPNEFHVLGGQMIANCLEAEGWDVNYLGADTPLADLVDYVSEQQPDIVGLSVTMTFNLVSAKDIVEGIKKQFQHSPPRIMFGGLVFAKHPELVSLLGGDGYAENCTQAIELAQKWSMLDAHDRDR